MKYIILPKMASTGLQHDSEDDMDEFMDKFKTMKYKNAFNEDNWEEVRNDHYCRDLERRLMLL